MKVISDFYLRNNFRMHFIDSQPVSDSTLAPVLICPGLSETAEEYTDFLEQLLPRRGIVLSFRGRGRSDSPIYGYDLSDHIIDIEGIVEHLQLNSFHLFAYSRGVPYAIGFVNKFPGKPKSIILQDYPPMHKRMHEGWADDYIKNYLIPYQRTDNISEIAVRGIERDSNQIRFDNNISIPILVLRGMKEGSLISDEDVVKYKQLNKECEIIEFFESGHDIRNTEKDKHLQVILDFIDRTELNRS
ncbi:alpha/beta fold hydrolase [Cohnella cholangitidis]|uniref:Alpha/beta hydrolase n=1 Tax=Cohnella cholangitidis TaxID=2598458 RepID=A0A7G5BSW7_9BACL|nr:alpha/beta hydrolase [Cohnella cholangitidis]QMV40051.1 alpha/beta hydrolase [Cohnella cholangitidis]